MQIKNESSLNILTSTIIGAAIEVHRLLGPGLLESAYEACLLYELQLKNLKVEQQKPFPALYKDITLSTAYRLDILVEDSIIIEIKAISEITSLHEAQLLSYLKLSHYNLGLLINFNVKLLKDGVRRIRL